jgi:hypothetical protein
VVQYVCRGEGYNSRHLVYDHQRCGVCWLSAVETCLSMPLATQACWGSGCILVTEQAIAVHAAGLTVSAGVPMHHHVVYQLFTCFLLSVVDAPAETCGHAWADRLCLCIYSRCMAGENIGCW